MSTTDEIKARIDIAELISESGVKLRRSGKNYVGFCPFHANKHTPAFVVWPETGTWRCFGECNEGGDVFKFVMKKDGLDFREALARLAQRAGVELRPWQTEAPGTKEAHEQLRQLLEEACLFYGSQLRQNEAVLGYLREKRGLTDATIEAFGLGFAPKSFDETLRHFVGRGYSEQNLLDAGLVSERQAERRSETGGFSTFDRFRNRIMIPIRDQNGKMAGFGARVVDPADTPKFLNSPETAVFTKGRLLYGLDRARKPIRSLDQAIIVEGYLDVIALHQAGFQNAVSPMGTALTEDQLRLLKRLTRNIVLALDPDAAGQKAVLRGLEAARQAMDREEELTFDARGLLRHEARLQADLRVATLPDGLDPDEVVQRDPELFRRLIDEAQPVIEHVMKTLAQGQDLSDRQVASGISAQVLPLIRDLTRPEEREFYTQKLARFLRIDERAFLGAGAGGRRQRKTRRSPAPEAAVDQADAGDAPGVEGRRRVEAYVLSWLSRKPELLYRIDRLLQENGLATLEADDFEYTDDQLLLNTVRQSLEQDEIDPAAFVAASVPDSLSGYAQELKVLAEGEYIQEGKLLEDLLRGIRRMRERAANEKRTQYRFLQEEAQENGDADSIERYQGEVLRLTQLKRVLDQFERTMSMKRIS